MSQPTPPKKRTRLAPDVRARQILDGAIEFFAEVGMNGTTRELARRLGVTQALIYRYFPDKEDLLNQVYEAVFEARWKPNWEDDLRDRSQPMRDRLVSFYLDYARIIHAPEWVRIFLLAGLQGRQSQIHARYLSMLRRRLMPTLQVELRAAFGMRLDDHSLGGSEIELLITLHGMIFYMGIRKWIYRMPVPPDTAEQIGILVDMFLSGMAQAYARASKPRLRRPKRT